LPQSISYGNRNGTINKHLFPLWSVWIISAYIHLVQSLFMLDLINSNSIIYLLFLPILPFEIFASLIFSFGKVTKKYLSARWMILLCFRLVWWFLFYWIWVDIFTHGARQSICMKFFVSQFYINYYLVLRGQSWLSPIVLILWIALYEWITIKKRKARIFTSMILPNILAIALFFHLYEYGGIGGWHQNDIQYQCGVEKVFDLDDVKKNMLKTNHARGIYYDHTEKVLFAMYGCTYCSRKINYITIVRKSLQSDKIHIFQSKNIRQIDIDPISKTLFVGPWYQDTLYALSTQDLSIRQQYANQIKDLIDYWEPMALLKDIQKNRLYVGNDGEQALISYDLETGKIIHILHLLQQGLVRFGGPVWNIVQSHKTRKLYFVSGPGFNLYEIDPDTFELLKFRHCFDIIGTAIALDDQNDILYYQCGIFDAIYAIDVKTFEIINTYEGEIHARRMCLDKNNNCLYVLGYFSGKVFAVDLTTGQRKWCVHVGGSPHGMHFVNNTLWINSMAGVFQLNLETIWENQ